MLKSIILLILVFSFAHTSEANNDFSKPIIYILDTDTLNKIESSGYSLSEMLGHTQQVVTTKELYEKVSTYKDFADQIGRPIKHDPKTDQLPKNIPSGYG
ncbi:MAG: hypothetical protein KDD50_10550, partial [Bdellovibrionales bacterium]|nr:hypothetical protein [Bdellovibrionales bacterium]